MSDPDATRWPCRRRPPSTRSRPIPLNAPVAPPQGASKSLTIGAVCKALQQEFPDISISKIRYLEDQKLLAPRRTPGGYRLYSAGDVSRLRTILRLQRDEFLPLRVIRQELSAGARRSRGQPAGRRPRPTRGRARRCGGSRSRSSSGARCTRSRTWSRTRAPRRGSWPSSRTSGSSRATPAAARATTTRREREIVRAVTELARYGVAGRNLRVFKTSAERESALLQQILAPALRSRNPRAAQGGGRGAGEPRRGRVAPQAPAARARPAADRAVSGADLRALIRDIPDFPKPGIVFKDITPLLLDPHAARHRGRGDRRLGRPRGDRAGGRRRGARVHPRRGDRARAGRRVRARAQAGQAPGRDRVGRVHPRVRRSTRWRCTRTRSRTARAS